MTSHAPSESQTNWKSVVLFFIDQEPVKKYALNVLELVILQLFIGVVYNNILWSVSPTVEQASFMGCQKCQVLGGNKINLLRLKIVIQSVYFI